MSPGRLVPISSTTAWWAGPSWRSVSGRPHWLLRLPADGERARVDGDALHGHAQVAADQGAVGRPDDVLDGQHGRRHGLVHAGCLWLKIARATSRSSKGSTAGPTS